ncbi:hypothetical protein VB620_07170 [Nodularia harveyana UHCC-0300]|uniref:Uncharacterized protein n=1 Tax=Nodularia harveyana UHCC-0300 TaxID=2974287 RepID=A0ABU5UCR3_9CYAN|nr:hypothetical protein [Nodularia harveyana]MEA5581118.1 hypothetical protein [Nodularia harveyana UHCC-0300]
MKKQQLSLALSLALFGCLVGAPMKANAGSGPVTGGSFFNFLGNIRGSISGFTGFGGSGFGFRFSQKTQDELNVVATKILEEYQDVNMLFAVVQNKSLMENGESPIVDINMLNAAIVNYNNTVMESSPEELERLAKDPEFIRTGKMLKELRAVLKNN